MPRYNKPRTNTDTDNSVLVTLKFYDDHCFNSSHIQEDLYRILGF